MKITVIIPTYKPGTYLWECLDSLCNQSILKSFYELVIVLNGCTQPWLAELQDYVREHNDLNIRLLHTESPGVSNARNMALTAAAGEYIVFIDDDDLITETYLEDLFLTAELTGADVVGANVQSFRGDEKCDDYLGKAYRRISKIGNPSLYRARSYFSSSCCKIIRRSAIGDTRFDPELSIGEDSLFMATISKNVARVSSCRNPEAYYLRRLRDGSALHSKTSSSRLLADMYRKQKKHLLVYLSDMCRYNFLFFMTNLLVIGADTVYAIFKNSLERKKR